MPRTSVCITGGTGFIGRAIVEYLLEKEYEVVVITRKTLTVEKFSWADQVRVIPCDIFGEYIDLPKLGVDILLHLAWGHLSNYRSPQHFIYAKDSKAFICRQLKNGLKHVSVTGSCQEYGLGYGPLEPLGPLNPHTAYAQAKVDLHRSLRAACDTTGALLSWARIFYTYGAGQSEKTIISQLNRAIDNGDEWFDMSAGEQLRDYLPVSQVAEQISILLETKANGVFNIGSGEPISIRRLVSEHALSRKSSIKFRYGVYPYPDYETMAFWAG